MSIRLVNRDQLTRMSPHRPRPLTKSFFESFGLGEMMLKGDGLRERLMWWMLTSGRLLYTAPP